MVEVVVSVMQCDMMEKRILRIGRIDTDFLSFAWILTIGSKEKSMQICPIRQIRFSIVPLLNNLKSNSYKNGNY
jgi:hypothetical protein